MTSLRIRALLGVLALCAAASTAGCKPQRGEETVECTPGAEIWVGCNQACSLGECTGDPWLQICDGDIPVAACVDGSFIAENDDPTGLCFSTCPLVQMVCPESGHITVTLKGYTGRTNAFTCDWRVEERPLLSSSGAALGEASATLEAGDDAGPAATSGADAGTP